MKKILFYFSFMVGMNAAAQNPALRDNTFDFEMPWLFATGSSDDGYQSLVIQPDNKVIYAGNFNSQNYTHILRCNADGTLDTSFTGKANGFIAAVALQPDGKIIIGGNFTAYDNNPANYIARLNSNGTFDSSFNTGTGISFSIYWPPVRGIAIQPDGKILVCGSFSSFNGDISQGLVRLNSDGSRDTGFSVGSGANNIVDNITCLADGKILIGGSFSSFNGHNSEGIAKLNANGSVDNTFKTMIDVNTDNPVDNIVVLPDGKIIAVGKFRRYGSAASGTHNCIVKINANGTLDNTFTTNTGISSVNYIEDIELLPNGKFLICGSFSQLFGTTRGRLATLNPDGSVDTEFYSNPGFPGGSCNDVAYHPATGKIYIQGGDLNYMGEATNSYPVLRLMGYNAAAGTANFADDRTIVYPNPSDGNFYINLDGEGGVAAIFDLQGKQVWSGRVSVDNGKASINTNGLTAGMYIAKVISGDRITVEKIMIK